MLCKRASARSSSWRRDRQLGQKRTWTEAASSFATRSNVGEDAQIVSPRTGCIGGCVDGGVTAHFWEHSVRCLRHAQVSMHARLCECSIGVHQCCVKKFSSRSVPRNHESLLRVSTSHLMNCAIFCAHCVSFEVKVLKQNLH